VEAVSNFPYFDAIDIIARFIFERTAKGDVTLEDLLEAVDNNIRKRLDQLKQAN